MSGKRKYTNEFNCSIVTEYLDGHKPHILKSKVHQQLQTGLIFHSDQGGSSSTNSINVYSKKNELFSACLARGIVWIMPFKNKVKGLSPVKYRGQTQIVA